MLSAPDSRADQLVDAAVAEGLDALLVGDLVRPGDSDRDAIADVTWLTGFTGTSGLAAIGPEIRTFVTDFRYLERAEALLPASFELVRAEQSLVEALGPRLRGRVGLDPRATSLRERRRLGEAVGGDVELVEVEGLVERLRRVKDELEIEAIAAASELTGQVYRELEEAGLEGRSEAEVALWAERRMRELGAGAPAFPPIVAAGANGSLPHAEPGEHRVAAGELVVVDLGAVLDGYCSDCTRTYACGKPGAEEREVYELVLAAQRAALEAIVPGAGGRAVDAVARERIEAAGYGERFGHGTGHGVGISVHEPPRLSRRSEDELVVGDVVTVEPGVYLPGRFGVRIEDLVVVTGEGVRNLSGVGKELVALE
jgi:Xaa-Pro aminopeptidase